jgi:hypothetical protein
MTKLKFSDGIEIDTGGDFRIITLIDGIYVTGHGFLYPCNSYEEAEEIMKKLMINHSIKKNK